MILNGPDGWAELWGLNGNNPQERKRRHEVEEGFIIWAGSSGKRSVDQSRLRMVSSFSPRVIGSSWIGKEI